ncbi:alkaline phosphatase [uncultured Rikenella sp.]|uniref:alkaline phosphatase n=1 Tax=uncultured Rikenella sp. TaxID=368003 RepID=UPI002610A9EF|nr:alkaline phosphatase [uncultured Rikenella sp.]
MIKTIRAISLAVMAAGISCWAGEAAAKAPKMKHVVMIGSDGFSAEVVKAHPGQFPNLERMMQDGSYTLEARSVLPSSSAINWATLLMGAGSEMHGFTEWGSKTPEVEPAYVDPEYGLFPGIFGTVRRQMPDAVTGVVYSWDGIGYLFEKAAVDFVRSTQDDDDEATRIFCDFLREKQPTFSFMYISEPDHTGHTQGWMSPEYLKSCQKVDSLVGVIYDCVRENMDMKSTAVIFTSDHGGKGTAHGGKSMNEMQVPYIIVGRGIPANHKIERIVMKYDNAPTIADMLRIEAPEQWYGKSILR